MVVKLQHHSFERITSRTWNWVFKNGHLQQFKIRRQIIHAGSTCYTGWEYSVVGYGYADLNVNACFFSFHSAPKLLGNSIQLSASGNAYQCTPASGLMRVITLHLIHRLFLPTSVCLSPSILSKKTDSYGKSSATDQYVRKYNYSSARRICTGKVTVHHPIMINNTQV